MVFIYTSKTAIHEQRPDLLENADLSKGIQDALNDYYKAPERYDYIVLNRAHETDFYRVMSATMDKAKKRGAIQARTAIPVSQVKKEEKVFSKIQFGISWLFALVAVFALIALSVTTKNPAFSAIITLVIVPIIIQIVFYIRIPKIKNVNQHADSDIDDEI